MNCERCGAETEKDAALCPACEAEEKYKDGGEDEATLDFFAEDEAEEESDTDIGDTDLGDTDTGDSDADDSDADTDLNDFLEEENKTEDLLDGEPVEKEPPAHQKGLIAFLVSLAVIAVVGVFGVLAMFTSVFVSSPEDQIVKQFNRFASAWERGDMGTVVDASLPGTLESNAVPFFGFSLEELKEAARTELPDIPFDFSSDDSAFIRSFVKLYGPRLEPIDKDAVTINEDDPDNPYAEINVTYSVTSMDGEELTDITVAYMDYQEGTWYFYPFFG